jgi:hypothetical protein
LAQCHENARGEVDRGVGRKHRVVVLRGRIVGTIACLAAAFRTTRLTTRRLTSEDIMMTIEKQEDREGKGEVWRRPAIPSTHGLRILNHEQYRHSSQCYTTTSGHIMGLNPAVRYDTYICVSNQPRARLNDLTDARPADTIKPAQKAPTGRCRAASSADHH